MMPPLPLRSQKKSKLLLLLFSPHLYKETPGILQGVKNNPTLHQEQRTCLLPTVPISDMRTTMVNGLFVLMVLLGLASAQINFSTSWGKRAAAASAERMVTSHRASQPSGEVEAISPPTSGDELLLVPIQPKELMEAHQVAIKSLLFIHQVVEAEILRLDRVARHRASSAQ